MKRRLVVFSVIIFFCLMLVFPGPVFDGASKGILLWFQIVLPTLLPFMFISALMIHTGAIHFISRFFGPFLSRLLGVSGDGSFAVLTGFLCGYPMGAKTTAELLKTGRISLKEAGYLLSFCNNTSPMFIVSYLAMRHLKEPDLLVPSAAILFLSPLFCSALFRRFYLGKRQKSSVPFRKETARSDKRNFSLTLLDSCMMNSFEAIAKVGGYIMLFSILIQLFRQLPSCSSTGVQVFTAFLEVTNGIPMIMRFDLPFSIRWVFVMSLTSFGGLCAAAQTGSMIQGTRLKLSAYITEKLATMLVTSFLCICYLLFLF